MTEKKPTILPHKSDEKRYHVPAVDTHGHSVRVQFHLPPVMLSQVQKIIASKLTPLRRNGDLFRVGTYHMIKEIERLEGPIPSVTIRVDAILDIIRDDEMAADFEQVFVKLSKRIADHMGRGGENEARRLCLSVKKQIQAMPDGYWRDHYVLEFDQRFGHLLGAESRASLLKFDKED